MKKKVLNNFKNTLNIDKDLFVAKKDDTNNVLDPIACPGSFSAISCENSYIPSRIVSRIYPEYPNKAKTLGIEGVITVKYNVNFKGKIDTIHVLSAAPAGIFEENIRSAMRCWVYERNKPEKNLIVTFNFV